MKLHYTGAIFFPNNLSLPEKYFKYKKIMYRPFKSEVSDFFFFKAMTYSMKHHCFSVQQIYVLCVCVSYVSTEAKVLQANSYPDSM